MIATIPMLNGILVIFIPNPKLVSDESQPNATDSFTIPFAKWKPFLLLNVIFLASNLSGFFVVISYGAKVLQVRNAKHKNIYTCPRMISIISYQDSSMNLNSYYATILLGVVQMLGCIVGMIFTTKFGRKVILGSSALICFMTMMALAGALYLRYFNPIHFFRQKELLCIKLLLDPET